MEIGASVVICARSRADGEEAARTLCERGQSECVFVECDVRDAQGVRRVIEIAAERFGRLDCLINNAGLSGPSSRLEDVSLEEIRELIETNLVSYLVASKYALPLLRQARGSIVNIGSLAGTIGHEQAAVYCATKAAISGFTKALAIDEAVHGVRVNAVLPGNIITESRRRLESTLGAGSDRFHDFVESWQWLGHSGIPRDVGDACVFLAQQGRFITGVELIVSGGAELGYGPKVPGRLAAYLAGAPREEPHR